MATTNTGTVLVIGGTAKVGRHVVEQLKAASVPVIATSRSGRAAVEGVTGVAFDWFDEKTWAAPYAAANPITAVYITAPASFTEQVPLLRRFIDFARGRGTRRFVLLSSSIIEEGGLAMGQTHAYLRELGDKGEAEWAVLRPTWFQENFIELAYRVAMIKDGKLFSATGDGKIPFVSTHDIAAVAAVVLTSKEPPNRDYVVLGPELLTYADAASIISSVTGKKVVHIDVSEDEFKAQAAAVGLPPDLSHVLAAADTSIKGGVENRLNDVVFSVTGKQPRTWRETAEEHKAVWA